ncbi:ParB N-terminal domain-containing protein [bacterium]|nr:ParB N-terminal domain-containing protein [bacterium]
MPFSVIPVKEIREDFFFRFCDDRDIRGLVASVRASGVITPVPVLVSDTDPPYVPVAGFSRLRAVKETGLEEVPVRLLSAALPAAEHFYNEVRIHTAANEISVIGKARILAILHRLDHHDALLHRFADLLGIPNQPPVREELSVLLDLQQSVREYISGNGLSLKQCRMFTGMDPALQDRWMAVAAGLHMRAVELAEVMQLTADIAGRGKIPAAAVLESGEITAILESPDMNGSQKRRHLKKCLLELRYPELTSILQRLRSLVRESAPPACVAVDWDATLEEPGIAVSARLKTAEDLEAAAGWLRRPGLMPVLRDMLKEI